MASWIVMSFWFLQDLFFAILSSHLANATGTAFGCHAGGFIGGLLLALGCKALMKASPAVEETPRYRGSTEPAVIYLTEAGSQLGPFTKTQVAQMIALGSVGTEAYFWREGMGDWQTISDWDLHN